MFRTGKIKLNPQINLPFNFLIQKYFFCDNPTWNINYSEYLLMLKQLGKKSWGGEKNGIGIERIGIEKFEVELTKWN